MPNLLIKHKIWVGFLLILVLLLINAGISVYNLNNTRQTVDSFIEDEQPLVLAAHQFNEYLALSSAALGTFLLTKNDSQRQNYQNALYQAQDTLQQIQQMDPVKNSDALKQTVSSLQSSLTAFQGYQDQVLKLAKDRLQNEPALAFASETINPLANIILSTLTTMILSEDGEDVSEERNSWLNYLHEIRYNFSKLLNSVRLYINNPVSTAKQNLLNSYELINSLLVKLTEFEDLYNFEQEEGVVIVQDNLKQYELNIKTLMEISESKKRRMDIYLMETEILPLLKQMQGTIVDLVEKETATMKSSSEDLLTRVDVSFNVQLILAVFGLIVGVLIAFVISRMVTLPLNSTVRALQQAARGDGDLTRRLEIKSRDELGDLAEAFNHFSIKLQSLMSDVASCSSHLIDSAEKMNQVVSSTKTDILEQNGQIDEITSAIESMVQKVQNVTVNTGQASELAEQTSQNSVEGKKIVNLAIQSSQELALDVDQAAGVINALESDVESISGILNVIRDIADQINLLALNAAIEAARAGEQGRGFAVVADEVRSLANRTQDSTSEIQNMIQRLQSGSQEAVEVMQGGKNKAGESLQQAQITGQSLEKITLAIQGMLTMNKEISGATEEQRETITRISQNISMINKLSSQTAESSSVVADTGKQVNDLAVQLKNLISQFKV